MSLFEDVKIAFAGRYLLDAEIGEGGSARVYAAQDLKHNRRVAIKILKSEVAEGLAADRFLREIRVDAALQHPRILPLFDSGEVLGSPYFVMPFVSTTLRARLQNEATLPIADALRITLQIADALQYLHSNGLAHRDVKPENVLLQAEHVWLADFGIVRALQGATDGSVTVTGTAIGTPAYMSPEQRMGIAPVDGKSDQFSLACVLYEMLVGRPPKVFERPDALMTPHGSRVTPTSSLRHDVPKTLDDVLARALHVDENKRWPSVQEFSDRLLDLGILTPLSTPAVGAKRWSVRRKMILAGAGAVLIAATAYVALRPRNPALDALTVAVLPLAHEGDGQGKVLDGDDCSRLLRDAIGQWTGIRPVDDMQLRDVRVRMGRPETLDDAMKMAKRLGAGLAVWGVVGPTLSIANSSARTVRLFLYDVATGLARQEANGTIDSSGDLSATFQSLADQLLSGSQGTKSSVRVSGTRDVVALRAYLDGHRALNTFDVTRASVAFRRAVEVDSKFGNAYLWLAWSTMWSPEPNAAEWGAAATRALAVGNGLTPRDSVQALALIDMNEKRFVDACDLFRSLTNSDPRDFAAWYGLGECLSSDFTVIASATSPSKWQFRTSIREAITAYERSLDLVPSFTDAMGQRAMQRISRLLFAQPGRYRTGLSADSIRFVAWPSLNADTLAFIPFEERSAFANVAGTRDESYLTALRQNRERVLTLVNHWVGLDSMNLIALEALALAREQNDELVTLRRVEVGSPLTGIGALRRARTLASGDDAIRLAATEVRFLIKTDRYAEAKRLADSLLSSVNIDGASAPTGSFMQSCALLTGRLASAVRWGRQSIAYQYRDALNPEETVSPSLSVAGSDAALFSITGAPVDSLRASFLRVQREISADVASRREVARQMFLELPEMYSWPRLGPAVAPPTRASAGNRWLSIQLALARGDTQTARTEMWVADSVAARNGTAQIAFEIALVNSRIWLALNDTASAVRVLSASIDQVAATGEQLMKRPAATAAFVRLLIQRATLADAMHDSVQARAMGTRAMVLWRDADPMLASTLNPVVRWRSVPLSRGTQ
ncbi:MAG: protein kinase [Gemmatimonadaceae bacterium]